jgi:hypothetical protein
VAQTDAAPVLTPELVDFIHSGVAVGVASRDELMRPAFARAWGPHVSRDLRSLTVCISAAEGSPMRSNLEANGAVAIGFCPPTTAKAVQLKGVAVVLGEPGPDDLGRVERHVDAFRANAELVGVPPAAADRISDAWSLMLISVSIEEGFDQAPGPMAGRRL